MSKRSAEPSNPVGDLAPGGMAFGDLLREYRTRAGISQEQLAERARISAAAVGALERGIRRTPYRSTVSLLATALGLSEEDAIALAAARDGGRVHAAKTDHFEHIQQPRTSFIGRDPDVVHIIKLFTKSRLVTVTGFGGIGKTRAALEVLNRVVPAPWPETCFVDLAPLTDGAYIAAKIASTVRPPLTEGTETIADLAQALARRRMLLVFDNCEHLIAEVSQAADAIWRCAPRLRSSLLVASRSISPENSSIDCRRYCFQRTQPNGLTMRRRTRRWICSCSGPKRPTRAPFSKRQAWRRSLKSFDASTAFR